MKAYVIVQETVKDEEMFAAYRNSVVATLEEFGGRFIVRGGQLTVVEGEWPHPRLVVIEFPSRAGGRRMVPFPRLPEAAALAAAQLGREPRHRRRAGVSRCAPTSSAPIPSPNPTTPTSRQPPARRSSGTAGR